MSSLSTIHTQMAEAWNRRDFAAMRNLLHPEYSYTGPDGEEKKGPEAGIQIARMYATAFPDGRLEVKQAYTHGTTAIAEMVARGTHGGDLMGLPPTGRTIEVLICNVMELRDGKIYREREYMDMMTMLAQIGAVTLPAQARSA